MHDIFFKERFTNSMTASAVTGNSILYIQKFLTLLFKLSVLIIFISVLVPLSPKMPAPGLDPSWAIGLNQAIAQGLSFGKEIIFTLGPYSSIYTKAYHPATDLMMVSGSLYLALSYWGCILLLMRGIKWHWSVALAVCFFAMIYARDSLLFTYPLLAGLVSFKIISQEKRLSNNYQSQLLIALVFAPFGLLPLIKGSVLILCISILILCALFFITHKKNLLALICMLSPLISILVFWSVSGQSTIYLPQYIINSLTLASGFTEAMANDGNTGELIYYLVAALLILLSIAGQKYHSKSSRYFLFSIFFVFLFISFKTGFTRHYGHAFIPGTSILIAALLLPYFFNSKLIIPVIAFSLYTSNYINGHYTKISIANNFYSTYSAAWYGLKNRLTMSHWLNQNYALTLQVLKDQAAFPQLQGTTDMYSYEQSYLIASGIAWSPRPVFQSYSVFNSIFAEKNKEYLLSEHRPDNIIFKVEPIDGRIPSLEDGISWPILISTYQPAGLVHDFLLLRKKEGETKPLFKSMHLLKSEHHVLDEIVTVPNLNEPIFAELNIKPTVLGLLGLTFFKIPSLEINFELKNGLKKHYRIIANMAKSGFLLSPLIENTQEFSLLYRSNHDLDNKQIKSFSISSSPNKCWYWHSEYQIHFKTIDK